MPPPNSTTDAWTPEPELREAPPRRSAPLEEAYPDLNRPSLLLYTGVGGVALAAGMIMLFVGFLKHPTSLALVLVGILLALAGAVLLGLYPAKIRSHEGRIEHLVTYGVPVMARALVADNMTGDIYARSVKYQVVLPGGEIAHRSVNCDERRLPRSIPSDLTALIDMQTSDVELYCALPLRAVPRGAPVSQAPILPTSGTSPRPCRSARRQRRTPFPTFRFRRPRCKPLRFRPPR